MGMIMFQQFEVAVFGRNLCAKNTKYQGFEEGPFISVKRWSLFFAFWINMWHSMCPVAIYGVIRYFADPSTLATLLLFLLKYQVINTAGCVQWSLYGYSSRWIVTIPWFKLSSITQPFNRSNLCKSHLHWKIGKVLNCTVYWKQSLCRGFAWLSCHFHFKFNVCPYKQADASPYWMGSIHLIEWVLSYLVGTKMGPPNHYKWIYH